MTALWIWAQRIPPRGPVSRCEPCFYVHKMLTMPQWDGGGWLCGDWVTSVRVCVCVVGNWVRWPIWQIATEGLINSWLIQRPRKAVLQPARTLLQITSTWFVGEAHTRSYVWISKMFTWDEWDHGINDSVSFREELFQKTRTLYMLMCVTSQGELYILVPVSNTCYVIYIMWGINHISF